MMFTKHEMNPSELRTKANLLSQTIQSIEECKFVWGDFETCIIGNMAKIVLERDLNDEDYSTPWGTGPSWSCMFEELNYKCPDTSLPVATIFQKLQDSGFTLDDIKTLEFGSKEEYSHWHGSGDCHKESKESVLTRLKLMLQEIEEEISRQPVRR